MFFDYTSFNCQIASLKQVKNIKKRILELNTKDIISKRSSVKLGLKE